MAPVPRSESPDDLDDMEVKSEIGLQAADVSNEVEEDGEEPNEEQSSQAGGSEEPRVNGHDGDGDDEENEDEEDGSPRDRKRVRVDEEGTSRGVKEERPRQTMLIRNDDGYVTGSIVRIALESFMTYDTVEFRPGPYLNMVLGPNGTGKSSIASAICLGLGYSPAVLNRAGSLKDFVKHGAERAWIELELKGQPGKANLVIRRFLHAANDTSTFHMNGKAVPQKDVKAAVATLNVQVDNLCAFLPQDRVSEFAQLTPQQLLLETQKAAGEAKLTEWHHKLIEQGSEHEKKTTEVAGYKTDVEFLQQKNSGLEREVERFRQRKQILDNIKLLELQIPFAQYGLKKREYDDKKAEHKRLGAELVAVTEEDSPLQEFKKEQEELKKKLDKNRKKAEEDARKKTTTLKKKVDASTKEEENAQDAADRMSLIRKNERDRREKIAKLQKEVERLQKVVDEGPPDLVADHERLNDKRDEIHESVRVLNEEKAAQQARYEEAVGRSELHKAQRDKASADLKALDDRASQQLAALGKWDRDCADAIRWLRQNGDKFNMEVIEPPMISLIVKDARYTELVENNLNANQLKTFVCQSQEDAGTLNRWLNDTSQALGRKARINVWFRPMDLGRLTPPPVPKEALEGLGFDGYAIDFVDAPPPLFWFLQKELNFHRTAIALSDRRVDNAAATDALSKSGNVTFIAGKVIYQVSRSSYGQRKSFTVTRDVRPARNLAQKPADPNERRELIEKRAQETQALEDNEASVKEALEEGKALKARETALKKAHADYEAERNRLKKLKSEWEQQMHRLGTNQTKLTQELDAPTGDDQRVELKAKLLEHARNRTTLALEYTAVVEKLLEDYHEVSRLTMELAQIMSNISYLEKLGSQQNEAKDRLKQAWEEANDAFLEAKADAQELLNTVKRMRADAEPELLARFDAVKDLPESKDVEALEQRLEVERANLDLNLATNEGVVRKYEKQQKEIERLQGIIADREATIARTAKKMKDIKDRWYPALQELVANINEKFSDAFSRIGCVGEVKIGEHPDYAQWSIDIWVKFRDNEQLQRLTGQRQSGGERALTTIFYLMSLTELARAPFSLVDEINQGMDQRYERAVHNNLVEVTCRDNSGQYFLITPKLLPNLSYDKRMKILCVNNGEWLNDAKNGKTYGNMRRMLEHNKYYPIKPRVGSQVGSPAVSVH